MRRVGTAITGITTCSSVTAATPFYNAFAAPSAPNTTGVRYFGINENNTVFAGRATTSPSAVTVRRDDARGQQRDGSEVNVASSA